MTTFNSLELALDYLERHFFTRYIFPIAAGKKFPPCLKDNLDGNCSNDPEQIKRWAAQFKNCNWGLAHRKSGLLVADIDTNPAKGKQGQATYDALDLMYGWPETEKTVTPSGGFHMIYEGWEDDSHPAHVMALGTNGLGRDIDSPNYTLIPGCTFADGTRYVGNDADAVKCPEWIYDTIKSSKTKARISNAGEVVVDLDQPQAVEWAIDFLKEDAEPAIEGKGSDITTYKTAASLKDNGISPALALDLMLEYYAPRCSGAFDRDWVEKKIASAYTYTNLSKAGGKTAEADFSEDAPETDFEPMGTWQPETKSYARKDNIEAAKKNRADNKKREAAKDISARPKTRVGVIESWVWVIGMKRWFNKTDPRTETGERDIWDATQFDSEYNKILKLERGGASDKLLRMTKGGPATYYRVGFKPGQPRVVDFGETYNLYRDPDIEAAEGDITWWNEHLEYLFPDEASRNHLLNWMAWLLQNIEKKPKHALIVQGEVNGTGKSFIADVLTRILHPANVSIVPQNGLSGRFNAWALQCKLIVVEELRASDKGAVKEALHDIITQETISIEKKGVDPMKIDNCFGIFALTNDDAALTLDNTDRRYLVIRTDRTKEEADAKTAEGYFVRLFARLKDAPSMAAVKYSLEKRDLQGYNAQAAAPNTAAKDAMKAASADELEVWMNDNRGNYPLSGSVIQVEDVINALPRRLESRSHKLATRIKSILIKKHRAEYLGQQRLPDGLRVHLYAVNGKAALVKNVSDIGTFYMNEKAKASSATSDDAGSDFEGVVGD